MAVRRTRRLCFSFSGFAVLASLLLERFKHLENISKGEQPMFNVALSQGHAADIDSCHDRRRLMPGCTECIPGLVGPQCEVDSRILSLRQTVKKLTFERYGTDAYDLYPYLNTDELRARQASVAQWLSQDERKAIIEIGPNHSPLLPHFPKHFCPELIMMVEPIGELTKNSLHPWNVSMENPWLSQMIKCPAGGETHIIIAPTGITGYLSTTHAKSTTYDAVVCLGCDPNYGPKVDQLLSFVKPQAANAELSLYLEDAVAYVFWKEFDEAYSNRGKPCGKPVRWAEMQLSSTGNHDHSLMGAQRKIRVYNCTPMASPLFSVGSQALVMAYDDAAKEANKILSKFNIPVFSIINPDEREKDIKLLEKHLPRRTNKCDECSNLLGGSSVYDYRTPFMLSEKADIVQRAKLLLKEAEDSDIDPTEGASRASTVRILLNAGLPTEMLICEECTLYRAIVKHNFHLRRLYSAQQPVEPPINPTYRIGSCPKNIDSTFKAEVDKLEHILPNCRNMDFVELGQMISMTPYIILPSIPSFKEKMKRPRRTILVDVGPNQFYASPKNLIDAYAPFLKFQDVFLFDMRTMDIPSYYATHYNISTFASGSRVGTRDIKESVDIVAWLGANVKKEDYVVLKYDVDSGGNSGGTLEWGFLLDLIYSNEVSLVDELYIELHFWHGKINWLHEQHNMRQAFDIFRQLRSCGMAIHSWP